MEPNNEDLEGRILKQQEENHHLRNFNQELEEQVKKLKEDKKSQDERLEKIQTHLVQFSIQCIVSLWLQVHLNNNMLKIHWCSNLVKTC